MSNTSVCILSEQWAEVHAPNIKTDLF